MIYDMFVGIWVVSGRTGTQSSVLDSKLPAGNSIDEAYRSSEKGNTFMCPGALHRPRPPCSHRFGRDLKASI